MQDHPAQRLSIAPMMDWTDRHCRRLHRALSARALLYTEMVVDQAIVHGPRHRLLDYDAAEHPLALQIGGSEPQILAEACRIAGDWGYDEINLNCGCPSDRVKSGAFGAVLMTRPEAVGRAVAAMIAASPVAVTVKCRLGVDDQDPAQILPYFLRIMAESGVRRVIIHARKAWLQGLSPHENRTIPPLDYDLALAMKAEFPGLHISVNGGVDSLDAAQALLARGFDGVMIGRAAYHEPAAILSQADARIWGDGAGGADAFTAAFAAVEIMRPYIARHLEQGGRLHQISRHMLGLFHGQPGARAWRRILSEGASAPDAGLALLDAALLPLREGAGAA